MPNQASLNPLILSKFVLWIAVVVIATLFLNRRKVTAKVRLVFLIGGVLVFGFAYALLIQMDQAGANPNPVLSLRTLLTSVLVQHRFLLPIAGMLVALLLMVLVSNKSICGWGCQLGLLQDLLYRVKLPKWKPPFWLSNTVRVVAFVALIAGLVTVGVDWIKGIDPFQLFSFKFTLGVGLFSAVVLVASLFIYRPWCQFLCPFGLVGWLVEQVSLLRPRINRDVCKRCQLCVKACPTHAMEHYYEGKAIHADCFACGACIEACPVKDALGWRIRK
ncbi:MAG TPA: 4Fe-4S binding protein [Chloroflexi bacterium]|nr:4Fe-4S binding protein [Chloroflexota bacterium]